MVEINDKVIVNGYTGVVKYIGTTEFADGIWYGIELDEGAGKNDGIVKGKRYFNLSKEGLYGIFARLSSLILIKSKDSNNDEVQISGLREENKRLLDENTQLRRRLEITSSEDPDNVIEFLTIQNTEQSKTIESSRKTIIELEQKHEMYTKLQAVYVELEKELREELEELQFSYNKDIDELKNKNAELMQSLANKNYPELDLADLKSKLNILRQELYENKFLKGLYELTSKKETRNAYFQFSYLSERILDDHIRNSFLNKQKCRFLLLVSCEISKVVEGTDLEKEFQSAVGDMSTWTPLFLEGFIPDHRIELVSILNFLNAHCEIDRNCLLVVGCFEIAFGSIVPNILAFQLENTTVDLDVKLVSEIYSHCLSIQNRCQELMSMDIAGEGLLFAESFSAQILFENVFYQILGPFEDVSEVRKILDLVKNLVGEFEHIKLGNCIKKNEPIPSEDITRIDYQREISADASSSITLPLENLVHEKDSRINELMIKTKILQQRVSELEGHQKSINALKTELDASGKENSNLMKTVCHLEDLVADLQEKLKHESLKAYQLVASQEYNDLASELVMVEKLDLISQIRDLRQTVTVLVSNINKAETDLKWLEQPTFTKRNRPSDIQLSNNIQGLTNNIFDFLNYSACFSFEGHIKENYLSNAIFKKNVIEMGIENIVAERTVD